jgi:hypothetical protein
VEQAKLQQLAQPGHNTNAAPQTAASKQAVNDSNIKLPNTRTCS